MFDEQAKRLFGKIDRAIGRSKNAEEAYKGLYGSLVHFHGSLPRNCDATKNIKWQLRGILNGATIYNGDIGLYWWGRWFDNEKQEHTSVIDSNLVKEHAKTFRVTQLKIIVGDAQYVYDPFEMVVLKDERQE